MRTPRMSPHIWAVFFLTLFLFTPAAMAQNPDSTVEPESSAAPLDSEDAATGGGSFLVTPIEGCLKRLPPDMAEEIRLNFERPYQECQYRLRLQEQKKNSKKPGDADNAAPTKESADENQARQFIRVQKNMRETGFSPPPPEDREKTDSAEDNAQTKTNPVPDKTPVTGKYPLNSFTYNN